VATVTVTATPTTLDATGAAELAVTNTGSASVYVNTQRLRPGQRNTFDTTLPLQVTTQPGETSTVDTAVSKATGGTSTGTSAGTPPPADVAPRANGTYDGKRNLYLPTGYSLRRIQAAIAGVAAGQTPTSRAKIAWVGHSEVAGFGGTPGVNDAPVTLRKLLAARYPMGTGLVTAYNNNGGTGTPTDARWAFDAGWVYAGGSYGFGNIQLHRRSTATGNNATFTSDILSTNVDIWTFGNTTALTYTVRDNTGATISTGTITPNAATATLVQALTGLVNAKTVVVTSTAAGAAFILGVNVRPASAVEVSGFGFWGAEASDFIPAQWFNPYQDVISYAPNLAIVQLDVNEAVHAKTTTALQTNLSTIVAGLQAAGSDVALVASCQPTGVPTGGSTALTAAAWSTFRNAVYNVADTYKTPLIDITDRFGPYATANANGMMYDVNHPNGAGYTDTALAVFHALNL
jgi:hypothetical protein